MLQGGCDKTGVGFLILTFRQKPSAIILAYVSHYSFITFLDFGY